MKYTFDEIANEQMREQWLFQKRKGKISEVALSTIYSKQALPNNYWLSTLSCRLSKGSLSFVFSLSRIVIHLVRLIKHKPGNDHHQQNHSANKIF